MPTLKEKLTDTTLCLSAHICTIPSAAVSQAYAAAGADMVIIDLEHGAIDFADLQAMTAATQGTECAPLVRVPEIDEVQVKRALDMGAEGICFPLVRSAEDARRAVASMYYPPKGVRGFGPFIAHSRWGTAIMEYPAEIEKRLICCLLVETADAVENIEEICAVPGIDMIVPAQFDLSSDMGLMGQFDHPDFRAAVERVMAAARAANLPVGQVALDEAQAKARREEGCRVLVGFDIFHLKAAAGALSGWCA
jgi:4-hydroxy-2-oxoheptanedioate aldolase